MCALYNRSLEDAWVRIFVKSKLSCQESPTGGSFGVFGRLLQCLQSGVLYLDSHVCRHVGVCLDTISSVNCAINMGLCQCDM